MTVIQFDLSGLSAVSDRNVRGLGYWAGVSRREAALAEMSADRISCRDRNEAVKCPDGAKC